MTLPHRRRRDPVAYTRGWELAAAVICAAVFAVGFAALLGLGVASRLFGSGWVWPHGTDEIGAAVAGIASGHPGRGLPPTQQQLVAGADAVYACVIVLELVCGAVLAWGGLLASRRLRSDGMATRWEAQQALGLGQLHQAKAVIRPDLYGNRKDSA